MQDLMPAMQDLWQNLVKQFTATFITEQRYMLFLNGLKNYADHHVLRGASGHRAWVPNCVLPHHL